MSKEAMDAESGANSGLDAAKMIITVIITGKQSIRENICTWNFGCKSWRQLKIMNREIDNPELLEEENVHGTD